MISKKELIIATGLSLALFTLNTPMMANADSTTATGQGDTTVTFTAPTTGSLVLNKVPSYDFSSHELASSYSGFTATGSQAYDVTDLTGGNTGYTITANASTLKNGDNVLPVSTFTTTTADGVADATTGGKISGTSAAVNIYQTANTVATGNENSNGNLTSGTTGATMALATANGVKAGTYSGTIDYNISTNLDQQ